MRVLVIGAGAMGIATSWQLAKRGHDVVTCEQFEVNSWIASSAGSTRTFRMSYERDEYIRMTQRTLALVAELEALSGQQLLRQTGLLERGRDPSALAAALARHDIEHRFLATAEIATLFPELRDDGTQHLFHASGGTMFVPATLHTQADAARALGAEIREHTRVVRVDEHSVGVRAHLENGEMVDADRCVLCPGPWANALLEPLGLEQPLGPGIAQVTYFEGRGMQNRPAIASLDEHAVYGHPVPGVGYKLAYAVGNGADWDPDRRTWDVDLAEQARLVAWAREFMPGLDPTPLSSERHPWTMTPDVDIILDQHGPFVIGAGCAGHSFKLGPAIGEILADLCEGVESPLATPFSIDRSTLQGNVDRVALGSGVITS